MKAAGLPVDLSTHSFRVTVATDLLGHSDPRTTRLYDRRQQKVSRNIVERISV